MNNSGPVEELLSLLERPIPLVDHDSASSITQFYKGRSVFITGATGFIGKALAEKLIRSCPEIKRIYLLIREKRGKAIEQRLDDLLASKCFDRIRELNNGSDKLLREKLSVIKGDITLASFGVSESDMNLLSTECTVVFNSAATIRFVEPIEIAVRNNIYSVGQLVEFCNKLANLEALVHLSTAYSNCHKKDTIYEIFYEPPIRGDDLQDAIKTIQQIKSKIHVYPSPKGHGRAENRLQSIDGLMSQASRDDCEQQRFYFDKLKSDDLLEGPDSNPTPRPYDLLEEFGKIAMRRSNRPNTYTFTKAVSEYYLLDRIKAYPERYLGDGKIPVSIVRPSIVGGAWREPEVGLVDNFNGPVGPTMTMYTGALQAMPGVGDLVGDWVPVDMVANAVLAVGWFLATKDKQQPSSQQANHDQSSSKKDSSVAPVSSDQGIYLFNMISSCRNPMPWHLLTDNIMYLAYNYPSKYLARLAAAHFFKPGRMYELYDRVNHKFPAYLIDFIKKNLLGQQVEGRNSALSGYGRMKQMTETLTPFTSNQWSWSDSNTCSLFQRLDHRDKSVFHFDVKSIDWNAYLRSFITGTRVNILKDEPKSVPAAIGILKRRQIMNYIFMAVVILFFSLIFLRLLLPPI